MVRKTSSFASIRASSTPMTRQNWRYTSSYTARAKEKVSGVVTPA